MGRENPKKKKKKRPKFISNEYRTYREGEKKGKKDRLLQVVCEQNTWLYTLSLAAGDVLGVQRELQTILDSLFAY